MLLVPLAREKLWIKACALGSAMATGSRALLLLCKKTRRNLDMCSGSGMGPGRCLSQYFSFVFSIFFWSD